MLKFSWFFGALPFNHSSVKTKLCTTKKKAKNNPAEKDHLFSTVYNLEKVTKGSLSKIFCTERKRSNNPSKKRHLERKLQPKLAIFCALNFNLKPLDILKGYNAKLTPKDFLKYYFETKVFPKFDFNNNFRAKTVCNTFLTAKLKI